MEAVAKHDFVASAEDELSFKKGSVLKIMKIEDESNWLSAEKDGRTGLVPANYITFIKPSWFHGKISRVKAEGILMQQQFDGAFLIRESESSPGDFSLSVRFCEGVQHFKVLRDGAGKYFLWIKKFNSLNELVACHRSESVSRSQSIFLREMAASEESEIYIAAYEFQPEEEGELYFKRGDDIQVLDREDANWWKGRNMSSGLEGLFPATYVQKKK